MGENELIGELTRELAGLPGITEVRQRKGTLRGPFQDALVELRGRGGPRHQVVVEAVRRLFPSQLADLGAPDGKGMPLIAAEALSPGVRALLRARGVGYWDRSGSLYLPLPGALYYIEKPTPKGPSRQHKNLFQGASSRVLHYLLLRPQESFSVQDVANEVGVSLATVHAVFASLEEEVWMERHGRGPKTERHLIAPGAMLDAWAAHYSLKQYRWARFFSLGHGPKFEAKACQALALFSQSALTLESGAFYRAPFLTTPPDRWVAHVPLDELDQVPLQEHGWRPVEDGATLILLAGKEPSPRLHTQKLHGWNVASAVQLYLDLWSWPRRGKEQAQHLRQELLGY